MASMAAFSTTFFTPLQHRTSTSLPTTLIKSSSLASSNSPFLQHHAFSQQTSFNSHNPVLKSRSFSVNAKAITDKTIYDFTVKDIDNKDVSLSKFKGKEPGSNEEIKQFACTKFKAEFPIFDKVDVNGPFTAPVYQFLKSSSGGFFGDLIKWNFEKFLVDKNGKVVERYPPTTSPFQIEKDIQKLLAA
ncbi:hypothetical protein TSUD_07650 [Trifolium subterraneum]|uniref:Glutathione peroxidase n=1 Tax=Trifolium subterraneum TaxID=3900 RepID=A0A2Z6LNQ6_TRISU|nr:hypothetical protein TSUD_07650 [Trifolium subterraneum]